MVIDVGHKSMEQHVSTSTCQYLLLKLSDRAIVSLKQLIHMSSCTNILFPQQSRVETNMLSIAQSFIVNIDGLEPCGLIF